MNVKNGLITKIYDKAEKHFFFILKDERIISVSKNINDILGFNEEEFLNKQIKEFFIDENEYLNFCEYLYKKDKEPLTIRLLSKDKKEKVFDILFNDFEKETELISIILKDITEEKRLKDELEEAHNKLKKYFDDILRLITRIIEKKDPYTLGHQAKVAKIATKIAEKLNLSKEKVESIRIASYLHDIGKIVLPSEILNKPGKLTKNEYLLVQEHSKAGYDILKCSDFLYPIAEIVYQHHERLDGSGYPKGLKDDQ
ncbi:MAG: HD domain-containing phosphohydrolase, partial [Caldisericia bacterium]